jgi:hypothetical protein
MTKQLTPEQIYQQALKTNCPQKIHKLLVQFLQASNDGDKHFAMFQTISARMSHMMLCAKRTDIIQSISFN